MTTARTPAAMTTLQLAAAPTISDFKDPAGAQAQRAARGKQPSDYYEVSVLARHGNTPGVKGGEYTVGTKGLEAALLLMGAQKPGALQILLMRHRCNGTRINKPAAVWYALDYTGKRI